MFATLIVLLIAAVGGWFVLKAQTEARAEREAQIAVSQDRLRTITLFMVVRATEKGWTYAPYDGKRFVLAALAFGDLDRRRRENLQILWSPTRDAQLRDLDLAAYAGVTKAALAEGLDASKLTSHAGRLNNTEGCRITGTDAATGTPILADATIEGSVVIAFTDGSTRAYSYADLGLPEDGPVVFGPDSPAVLLRCLSDK